MDKSAFVFQLAVERKQPSLGSAKCGSDVLATLRHRAKLKPSDSAVAHATYSLKTLTMINRRKALFTAAVAAGTVASADILVSAATDSQNPEPQNRDSDLATIATECATACSEFAATASFNSTASNHRTNSLIAACEECRDLCIVTAKMWTSQVSPSPAILQSCGDSCSRLVAILRRQPTTAGVRKMAILVNRCADECRLPIG